MEEDAKLIKKNALKFSWYMRGGVSYEDVLNMSDFERQSLSQIVDENSNAILLIGTIDAIIHLSNIGLFD